MPRSSKGGKGRGKSSSPSGGQFAKGGGRVAAGTRMTPPKNWKKAVGKFDSSKKSDPAYRAERGKAYRDLSVKLRESAKSAKDPTAREKFNKLADKAEKAAVQNEKAAKKLGWKGEVATPKTAQRAPKAETPKPVPQTEVKSSVKATSKDVAKSWKKDVGKFDSSRKDDLEYRAERAKKYRDVVTGLDAQLKTAQGPLREKLQSIRDKAEKAAILNENAVKKLSKKSSKTADIEVTTGGNKQTYEVKAFTPISPSATKALSHSHVSTLNSSERSAVSMYTGSSYKQINGALRAGGIGDPHVVSSIDSAISKSRVDTDMLVYRGMSGSTAQKILNLKPGATFSDKAYVSTTTNRNVTSGFGASHGVLIHIRLPKGSPGLSVEAITLNANESEILLPRNTKFKVIGKMGREVTVEPIFS